MQAGAWQWGARSRAGCLQDVGFLVEAHSTKAADHLLWAPRTGPRGEPTYWPGPSSEPPGPRLLSPTVVVSLQPESLCDREGSLISLPQPSAGTQPTASGQ